MESLSGFVAFISVVGPITLAVALILVVVVTAWEGMILRFDKNIRVNESTSDDVIVHSPALAEARGRHSLFYVLSRTREYVADINSGAYPKSSASKEDSKEDTIVLA